MSDEQVQYLSQEKFAEFQKELAELKRVKIPLIAKRIDDARQMGDLSENAEYHAAREEMSWAQGRAQEIEHILQNVQMISDDTHGNSVQIGSTIVVEVNGKKKEYTIVGAQEADPAVGKISNESPLGEAFLGKRKGDKVDVKVPVGLQMYHIIQIK